MVQQIAEEAEAADWQEHVEAALTRPTVTSLSALLSFPQRMEQVQQGLGGYSPGRVANNLNDAVSVAHALNVGKPKVALMALAQRRRGLQNGAQRPVDGDNNPAQPDRWGNSTEVTDALLGHIRSRDPERLEQAKGLAGMVIALSVDPEDVPAVLARAKFKDDRSAAEKREASRRLPVDGED